ncbi:MAG: 1-deoxy-D-xylulose-5-phosphate reductoisomerase, partial [Lachnospiraceae bacterium]|nr:1-deoxy-D-xylulose-5-phosphate reductoisomerase [Lachnospiraceae bacterium]
MKKTISILGSTGSIGTQTLEVVRNNPDLQVAAISGNKNIELLAKQILEFSPKLV